MADFSQVAPEGSLSHGIDAIDAAIAPCFETFASFHVAAESLVHVDQERVVTAIRDSGRIRASDAEITGRYFPAWTFRDGKVVRLSSHTDKAAALQAVGLEE